LQYTEDDIFVKSKDKTLFFVYNENIFK